jgi:hypothetical protein
VHDGDGLRMDRRVAIKVITRISIGVPWEGYAESERAGTWWFRDR